MNKKRILAIALAALMIVAVLAGCGKSSKPAETEPEVTEEPVEVTEEPVVETEEPAAETEEPSDEPSGEPVNQDFEIEVDGETVVAHYSDVDNGDQATKSFIITIDDVIVTGTIDKGVWTADSEDEHDQAIVDAVQAAFESASGEPSEEMPEEGEELVEDEPVEEEVDEAVDEVPEEDVED